MLWLVCSSLHSGPHIGALLVMSDSAPCLIVTLILIASVSVREGRGADEEETTEGTTISSTQFELSSCPHLSNISHELGRRDVLSTEGLVSMTLSASFSHPFLIRVLDYNVVCEAPGL